jgi:hypothetical protein
MTLIINNNKQQLIDIMNKFKLKSQFKNNTTNIESQSDHKWTNKLENECKSKCIKNMLAKFSQINLYNIQTLKHTFNL